MRDLYLRFENKEEMTQQLVNAGFQIDENTDSLFHQKIDVDVIGVIAVVTSVENQGQENEIIKYTNEPGYHVNLRVTDDELEFPQLTDFEVSPKTPARVWA